MVSKDETQKEATPPKPSLPWLVVSKEQGAACAPKPQPATSWKDILNQNAKSSFQAYLDDTYC